MIWWLFCYCDECNTQIMPPDLPIVHNSCNLLLVTTYLLPQLHSTIIIFLLDTRYYILFLSIDDHTFFLFVCIINKILCCYCTIVNYRARSGTAWRPIISVAALGHAVSASESFTPTQTRFTDDGNVNAFTSRAQRFAARARLTIL